METSSIGPTLASHSSRAHYRPEDERLQQALRTLRAIRERYETGHNTGSGYVRSDSVHVALGYADMLWITAVIEALEKAVSPSSNERIEIVQVAPRDTLL